MNTAASIAAAASVCHASSSPRKARSARSSEFIRPQQRSLGHDVGARFPQAQIGLRGEDARTRKPPPPQAVLQAGPQHAEAVDDRAPEADLARVGEVARGTGNFADGETEGERLH